MTNTVKGIIAILVLLIVIGTGFGIKSVVDTAAQVAAKKIAVEEISKVIPKPADWQWYNPGSWFGSKQPAVAPQPPPPPPAPIKKWYWPF